ncbi:MAG: nucleotide-binding universal stress UspA family protein [Bradymonadia bacterium]|jgi:nucleotide-binding universal stress UspA family protein
MIQHVIFATDLSEGAGKAAKWAADLSAQTKAEVVVAHVIEIGLNSWLKARYDDVVDDKLRAKAEEKVAAWYATHTGARPDAVDLRVNTCFNALTEAAAEHHADLLVMSPTGKSTIAQMVVGSRVQEIASRPPCPLAIVAGGPISKLSIAVDFSEGSAQALRWAHDLASGLGAELRIVHVADLPDLPAFDEDLFGDSFNAFYADAEATLNAMVAKTLPAGHGATSVVISGNPEDVLVSDAIEHGLDAIVVGQTGHDSVIGDILGSVPRSLINRQPCTIIVVPTKAPAPAEG